MGAYGRLDKLVLGLEVVVDVADRDVGGAGDVAQRRLLDALLVEDLGGGGYQPLALAGGLGPRGGPVRLHL